MLINTFHKDELFPLKDFVTWMSQRQELSSYSFVQSSHKEKIMRDELV